MSMYASEGGSWPRASMFEREALGFRFLSSREKKRIEKLRACSCYRIEKYKINKMIQNIECKTRTLSRYCNQLLAIPKMIPVA